MKEYGEFGETAGKHVLDCAGNPIYAGSYVHMTYTNKTKRVAQVFAESEAFELKNGIVIDEKISGKSEKILYQDGGWDRATSVYVVNGAIRDTLGIISRIERENKRLKVENEQLKAEIDDWKGNAEGFQPDAYMKLSLDADGVPIRIGDKVEVDGDAMTVLGYCLYNDIPLIITKDEKSGLVFTPRSSGVRHFKPEPPDSWEKLEEDAKMVKACDYAHAPRDEYGITVCRDCRFQKSKSCRQEMKKLLGVEEQEGE